MLISPPAKVVFIHNHKTGGVSTRHWMLEQYPETIYDGHSHESAREAVARIGEDAWNRNFSFGFVRNPWARMLSWWSMFDERRNDLLSLASPTWKYAQTARTFDEFIHTCTETIYEPGASKSFVRPQLDYFTSSTGKQLVSFIGRYETLQEDLNFVADRTGVPRRDLGHHNISNIPKDYRQYYNWHTRAIVGLRFQADIETFKYTF